VSVVVGIPIVQETLAGITQWVAGFYYVRHCLQSLTLLPPDRVPRVVVFVPASFPEPILAAPFAERAPWLEIVTIDLDEERAWERLERALVEHGVDVVFPLTGVPSARFDAAAIGWIPDFQHHALPQFFSADEHRNRQLLESFILGLCETVVCSSESVRRDLERAWPAFAARARVLHFRALMPSDIAEAPPHAALRAMDLEQPYVYLPNQFWVHKDHRTVWEAWARLRDRGRAPLLVCSGGQQDYRAPDHFASLLRLREELGLTDLVRLVGFLDRPQQWQLYRGAAFVLQPSLFEGWSTTIAEAQAIGSRLLVTDIPVHHEQCGDDARYFQASNPADLERAVLAMLDESPGGYDADRESRAGERALVAMRAFGAELVALFEETDRARRATPERAAERQALLDFIVQAGRSLRVTERDRAARLQVIEAQGLELGQLRQGAGALGDRLTNAEAQLASSEADRAARLDVIERQGVELAKLPALEATLAASEADRAARLEVIERQGRELGRIPALEADIEFLKGQASGLDAELRQARAALDAIERELARSRADATTLRVRIEMARTSTLYKALRRLGVINLDVPPRDGGEPGAGS
jgi:hypothetical protein